MHVVCSQGEKGTGTSGKPLHYKGSVFHRIIPQVSGQRLQRGERGGRERIFPREGGPGLQSGVVGGASLQR